MNNANEIDRITVLRCLIHTESDDIIDTEVLDCLMNKGYNGFEELCEYMAKENVLPEGVSCIVTNGLPQFCYKESGEIVSLASHDVCKEVPA